MQQPSRELTYPPIRLSGFPVTVVAECECQDSGTGTEPLIWLESEARVRFACSRCVAQTGKPSIAGSATVCERLSTDPWRRAPVRPDDIRVVLAPAWRLAPVRARARALTDVREALHSALGVFPDCRLADMTSLSRGTVSEYLSIAQLDPLIARVADEIRQEGGSIHDQVLNDLRWRPLRPIIREGDPSIQAAMIHAAYLAHLEGRSCKEIERRVVEAGDRASGRSPAGETRRTFHTPTLDGSATDSSEPTRLGRVNETIRRWKGKAGAFLRCALARIRWLLRIRRA